MIPDFFTQLLSTGNPIADLLCFYQAVGLVDTLSHVTRVAVEAKVLAGQHGVDARAAQLAALAHDLAAVVPVPDRPAVASQLGLPVGDADRAMPALLHGPIAAAIVEQRLGVGDEEVLAAVRYHSTLHAGAGTLEKVVFLADKIAFDHGSPHFGEYLPALRAAPSLDAAVLVYLDFLLDNTWRYGWYLHPHALAAYRELSARRIEQPR